MRPYIRVIVAVFVALPSVVLVPVVAQPAASADDSTTDDGLRYGSDAEWYAAHFHVSELEARRRLDLGDLAGELDASLSRAERPSFAGLWIVHEPEFAVEVRMLPGHEDSVSDYVEDPSLRDVLNVES